MAWRVLLTVAYAAAFGAVLALHNLEPGVGEAPAIVVFALAPVVGFLVGRWWVLLAVVGPLAGHAIGWDPASNDGNPAFWPPYVFFLTILFATPLVIGIGLRQAWSAWRRPPPAPWNSGGGSGSAS